MNQAQKIINEYIGRSLDVRGCDLKGVALDHAQFMRRFTPCDRAITVVQVAA